MADHPLHRLGPAAVPAFLLMLPACHGGAYVASADQEVNGYLRERTRRVLEGRQRNLMQPEPEKKPDAEKKGAGSKPEPRQDRAESRTESEVRSIDLARALRTAVGQNRDYLTRQEALYQVGLRYSLARFQFGPQLAATASLVWSDGKAESETLTGIGTLAASQILPTGGTLEAEGNVSGSRIRNADPERLYASDVTFRLSQPLLRGAGYEASHEALAQAERDLLYDIRAFQLFREDFSIQIARDFFDLISRQQTLQNEERDFAQAVFDRKKAEALYEVDRNTETEVFRARRREIDAENQLIAQRANNKRALDDFKIRLGLPTSVEMKIQPTEPDVIPVHVDVDSAVAAAKNNRLDIHTERDRIADAERAVRIAENALLPDLSLSLSYRLADESDTIRGALADDYASSVGVFFELPIQQKPERNQYRAARIALDQARRAYSLTLDNLELDIRDQLRTLDSLEKRVELQKAQIEREKRAVAVTQTRYEAGDLDNRDLLEAREGLINGQNELIRLKVDHFIGRLRLLRTLGLLRIDEEGMWR